VGQWGRGGRRRRQGTAGQAPRARLCNTNVQALHPPPHSVLPCVIAFVICSKPTRVGVRWAEDGTKVRVSAKTDTVIPYPPRTHAPKPVDPGE